MLLALPAQAQFLNRAVWLGSEEEGIRRDFEQGTEYFLDRMSYVHAAPWWERGLSRFGNEAQVRFGSVTGSEFSVESHLDHRVALGEGLSFGYHVLQGETRDTRFLRNAIGLEYELGDDTALFAQGTLLADKENIDVSVGAWLSRRENSQLRVMLTLVDAPSDKGRSFEYLDAPYGLQIAGAFGDPDSHRLAFDLGAQLPFTLRDNASNDRFELERYIGRLAGQIRLGTDDWLYGSLESEYTDKSLRPLAANAPTLEHFDRQFHQVRVEWWRDGRLPWSAGVVHTYHAEDGVRPNDPTNNLRTQRREWMATLRVRLRIDDKLSFEPQVLAGHVRDFFRDGTQARDISDFEGKISWNTRWDFSPNATLALIVSDAARRDGVRRRRGAVHRAVLSRSRNAVSTSSKSNAKPSSRSRRGSQ